MHIFASHLLVCFWVIPFQPVCHTVFFLPLLLPLDFPAELKKMYITFPVEKMSANWCREKTRTISGNIILHTNLPRDVREVSSFEAKKGTVEH